MFSVVILSLLRCTTRDSSWPIFNFIYIYEWFNYKVYADVKYFSDDTAIILKDISPQNVYYKVNIIISNILSFFGVKFK